MGSRGAFAGGFEIVRDGRCGQPHVAALAGWYRRKRERHALAEQRMLGGRIREEFDAAALARVLAILERR